MPTQCCFFPENLPVLIRLLMNLSTTESFALPNQALACRPPLWGVPIVVKLIRRKTDQEQVTSVRPTSQRPWSRFRNRCSTLESRGSLLRTSRYLPSLSSAPDHFVQRYAVYLDDLVSDTWDISVRSSLASSDTLTNTSSCSSMNEIAPSPGAKAVSLLVLTRPS